MEKAIPKHRPAKNPASQKAKPSPTKNRYKFQNNNPKNGASAACGASVVVLKFVSIFCRTWLGFLAGWILCWPMLWDGFFHGFLGDRKKTCSKSGIKNIFPNSGPTKTVFFEPNRFGTGTVWNRTGLNRFFSEPKPNRTEPGPS